VTRVKICGCVRAEDALTAAEAGADFVGFVFAESPRRLTATEAAEIVRALGTPLRELELTEPPAVYRSQGAAARQSIGDWFRQGAEALERLLARKRPLTVGVFAGMELETVNAIADESGVDLIQLSGDESWQDCLSANRQVIKVTHVRPQQSADDVLASIEGGTAIACMLDSRTERAYGGTGRRLNWPVAAGVAGRLPVWLAGGLTPENVADAIRALRPWAVDVSSGVETGGAKDAAKIRAFVASAKDQPQMDTD
jgi:phosphoribosylanthranilate isomerase